MKVFNRLKITAAPLFAGHKLKLEALKKQAKDERHCLNAIIDLEENSDVGQFGSYCKGFAAPLVYYWHIGGKKLTPTLKEINEKITDYFKGYGDYKSFDDLPSSTRFYFKR